MDKIGEQHLTPHVLKVVEEKIASWHGKNMEPLDALEVGYANGN